MTDMARVRRAVLVRARRSSWTRETPISSTTSRSSTSFSALRSTTSGNDGRAPRVDPRPRARSHIGSDRGGTYRGAQRRLQEGAGPTRSRPATGRLRGRDRVGGRGGEAGTFAHRFLARGDAAVLSAAGGGRDPSESGATARGRAVSMDEARLWRNSRLHGR